MTYRRRLKYYLIKLCRLHDSPKSVAGGFAWGTIIHFYPTCGFGALFTMALAGVFRTNMVAATLAWAVTMPLFPFFFYLNFVVGDHLVQPATSNVHLAVSGLEHFRWRDILLLGKAFIVGSVINSMISVIVLWWLGYVIMKRYRKTVLNLIRRVI